MEYTHIRYSDITTCIDLWVPEQHNWGTDGLQMNCVGEQSHAYIIKHPIETQWLLVMNNWHQVRDITSVLILWVPSSTPGGRMVSKWIVWGRAVSCLHNQAPTISTQLTPCDGIHSHQVQWHYYVYLILWVPELENWGTDGLQMNCVGGRAVSCLHNQAPNWNTIDFLWWNTLTSVQWHYYMYWFCWVPELENWGTDGLQMNCVGRAVSCLHNQAPNWNPIDSLWWNTLTSGTVTLLRVLILWVPEQHNWGTDGLQMNCVRRAVSCLHNQAPNLNTIDSLQWNTLTSVQWHYYLYWFCECQSSTTGAQMVSKWIVWGRAVSCSHNQAPNWNTIDSLWWKHWHQVQWHSYVYWFCECQSGRTGGPMVSKWIVWGRAVSCLHNQAPNWNTIDFLRWNTLTSGTVTLLRVLILWVPEQHNWGTDGLQMNCVGESSLMLHNQAPNWNTIDSLWWNTLTQVQWHYYVYWFCECQSWRTGGRMVSKWIVWGRAVSCLHNQAPNWNTIDSLWWNTLTSGTVTLLHVLILWVTELEKLGDGWSPNELCGGRAVSCLHNQAPNWNTIDSLWWNTLTSGTVTLLRVLILWVPEQHNWGTDGLQMNCVRESSLMLT